MSNESELRITTTKASHGNHRVIARLGEETLLVEDLKIGKSQERRKFAFEVVRLNPGLADQRDTIAEKLAAIAAADAAPPDAGPVDQTEPTPEELLSKMPQAVKDDAERMLDSPDLMQQILRDVQSLGVAGEDRLIQAVYLIGTSRLLPKPLAAIVQGPSSSGKSFVADQTSKLVPPEGILHATQMTPQSLFHLPPGRLRHRFILAGERSRKEDDDTAEATRALREMIASGKLTKMMPVKTNGSIETVVIEQDGPIGYLESTTLSSIFAEDRNRCILLGTDETPQQTERIVKAAAARSAGVTNGTNEETILRHHAMQRMLAAESAGVVVQFAEKLADAFGFERVEVRRAFPHLLAAIQAVTLLHQRQRERTENEFIVAEVDDYAVARHVFGHAIERSLGLVLSNGARRFLRRLHDRYLYGDFTSVDAVHDDGFEKSQVYGWLAELFEHGLTEKVEDGGWSNSGRKPTVWRLAQDAGKLVTGEADADPPPLLPPPESLR